MNTKSSLYVKRATIGALTASMLMGITLPATVHADQGVPVNLAPGTLIPVTLNNELTSNNSQPGDHFTASVDMSHDYYGNNMRGALVDGVVVGAVPKEDKNPGELDLKFTDIRLADGTTYQISGVPGSLDKKDYSTLPDGELVANNTHKDQHMAYAGIGAGAGAVLGVLSGGTISAGRILFGGALGYALGSIFRGPTRVHDVDLKPGQSIAVLLQQPVRYYHRSFETTPDNGGQQYNNNGN